MNEQELSKRYKELFKLRRFRKFKPPQEIKSLTDVTTTSQVDMTITALKESEHVCPTTEAHPCPYQEQIEHNDDPYYCTCCEACVYKCEMSI